MTQPVIGSVTGAVLAGASATLLGVGLQRFSYAPLLPAMVLAGWLGPGAAGALGAANLGGYLLGAALSPSVARAVGLRATLRGSMLLASVGFILCAWPGGLAWFLPWRLLAGMAGGALMVLAGPAVQQVIPVPLRGRATGAMFAGVGSGIVAGALLVPALVPVGLSTAWLVLAALALILTAASWRLWPNVEAPLAGPIVATGAWRLIACYGLAAAAGTPHMIWWPDYIARGLRLGAAEGALMWALYGAAAALAPLLSGALGDRVGSARAFMLVLALQVVAVGLPLLSTAFPLLLLSSVLAGGSAISIGALMLSRTKDVAGDAAPGVWRVGTAAYGAAQTVFGFVLAWVHAETGVHWPLFAAGLVCAMSAVLLARR